MPWRRRPSPRPGLEVPEHVRRLERAHPGPAPRRCVWTPGRTAHRVRLARDGAGLPRPRAALSATPRAEKPAHVPIAPGSACSRCATPATRVTTPTTTTTSSKGLVQVPRRHSQPDAIGLTLGIVPGKLFDILDYRLYDWPGHGTPEDASYQYNEKEWMKDDEYDLLIQDPSTTGSASTCRACSARSSRARCSALHRPRRVPFTAPFFVPSAAAGQGDAAEDDGCRRRRHGVAAGIHGGRRQEMATLGIPQTGRRRHQGALRHTGRHHARHARADARQVPPAREGQGGHGAPRAAADRLGRALRTTRPAIRWCSSPSTRAPTASCPTPTTATLYWPTFKGVLLGLIDQGVVPLGLRRGRLQRAPRGDRRPRDPGRPHDLDVRRHRHGAGQGDRRRPPVHRRQRARRRCFTMGTPDRMDAYVKDLLGKTAGDGGFILAGASC